MLQHYRDAFKSTRIRLYVQFKQMSIQPTESDDGEEDSFLLPPILVHQPVKTNVPLTGTPTERGDFQKQQEQ